MLKKLGLWSIVLLAFVAGALTNSKLTSETGTLSLTTVESAADPLYWVAPMDPGYRRSQPGISPMGMELIPVYAPGATGSSAKGENVVVISPAVENNLGVKTASASVSTLQMDLNTVGYVQFDEDRLHHVHLRVDGWIESLNVSAVGERVEAGQILFELYSPTLFNAQKDLIFALSTSETELLSAARQRLRLLGLTPTQIQKLEDSREAQERIAFYAQHSGIVSSLNVRHGMFIQPASEIMAIGSIDTVWVIAEVFERQLPWLVAGQDVTMSVDSYPGQLWQASVDYIYPVLNPQSRTVQVRIRIDNRDRRLRPNMFASLLIHTQDSAPVLNIPRSALILGGSGQRVVKALGDGRFHSVFVTVGREAGDQVEILSGLSEGDQVVVSAQFLIDSESNIDAESERLQALDVEGSVND
jgi:Cu(I)/Ag(I) efflux system membrane fusion protein